MSISKKLWKFEAGLRLKTHEVRGVRVAEGFSAWKACVDHNNLKIIKYMCN